jgi:Domain of unknown function (DUF4258)
MQNIEFSLHAIKEMETRQISKEIVDFILISPQQVIPQLPDRQIFQSILTIESNGIVKDYVVRVIVNIVKQPNIVVTVYRSSKISKYLL